LVDWNAKKPQWESLKYNITDCNDYTSPSTSCQVTGTYLFRQITNSTLAEHWMPRKSAFDACNMVTQSCYGPGPASMTSSQTIVV
jgi:hypothetical protein